MRVCKALPVLRTILSRGIRLSVIVLKDKVIESSSEDAKMPSSPHGTQKPKLRRNAEKISWVRTGLHARFFTWRVEANHVAVEILFLFIISQVTFVPARFQCRSRCNFGCPLPLINTVQHSIPRRARQIVTRGEQLPGREPNISESRRRFAHQTQLMRTNLRNQQPPSL